MLSLSATNKTTVENLKSINSGRRNQQQHLLHDMAGTPGAIPSPHLRQACSEKNTAFSDVRVC